MKYKLLIGLSLLASWALAQEDTSLLADYARQMEQVKTLQSNFTEEQHLSLLTQPLESSGRLSFDKNAKKLYWQYERPFQNGFLIEKEQVYRLQGNVKQPVQNKMGRMAAAQMVVWLTLDFESLKQDYQMALQGRMLTFTPRNQAHKVVKKIIVWLDEKNPQIVTQVQLEEPNGDFILWKFTNVRINLPWPLEV